MSQSTKWVVGIIVVVAVVAIGYFAFNGPIGPVSAEPIKVGVIFPLTGNLASYGEVMKKGIDLATDEINAAGGVTGRDLQIVYEDGQGDTKLSVSAYQKLVKMDGVKILFSTISGPTLAMAPLAEADKVLLLAVGVASPKLSEGGDYIFRHNLLPQDEANTLADFIYNKKSVKEVGLLVSNVEGFVGPKDLFKQAFEKIGGKIAIIEMHEKDATDYKTQLLKIKASGVKNVVDFSYAQELGIALKQGKEIGLNAQWFSLYPVEDKRLLEIAGESANGLIYTHFFNPQADSMKNFNDNYYKRYNDYPNSFAALSYDSVRVIAEAIKKCADFDDATCVKNELYQIRNFSGVTGKISFDKNGDTKKDIVVKTVKDGQFVKYEQ